MTTYTRTDQLLHWLCQVITKANRTYVPEKEDDGHTNLAFDALGQRLVGRWIKTKQGNILFTLNLHNLTFEIICQSRKVKASVPTAGLHINEVEQKIEELLPDLSLDPVGFSKPLHFEIPEYGFELIPQHLPEERIAEWKYYRQMANKACSLLLDHAQSDEEIRIWPHHFDTGIYTNVKDGLGLGFGLAMEDTMAGAPYFYMSGYLENGSLVYDNLPRRNEWLWKVEGPWKGVILPITHLTSMSHQERSEVLNSYLLENFNWFINQ